MALGKTLANPTIQVNDSTISILPNTLSYKSGKGNVTSRAQSAGGNSISIVVTEDATTKVSMVKFKMINTKTNIELVEGWQDNSQTTGNTIRFSDGDLTKSFRAMNIEEDPEIMLTSDGEIDLVFKGLPVR